MTTMFIPVMY